MFTFKKKHIIRVFLAVLIFVFLVTAIPVLRGPFLGIVKIPLAVLTFLGRETGALMFFHQNYVKVEKLQAETNLLKQKLNASREVFLENARLKEILDFRQRSSYRLVAARVIGHSPDSWSSLVIIDKGRYHGIEKGMAVVNYLGLLGKVIEAAQFTSKVMLVNDSNLAISGMVQRSRQEGLVSGTLGTYLIMKYLPEEPDIQVRDLVVSSGLNQSYPKGLLIGTVVDIGVEFSGLSRYAIIKPAANLSNIEEVLVVIR